MYYLLSLDHLILTVLVTRFSYYEFKLPIILLNEDNILYKINKIDRDHKQQQQAAVLFCSVSFIPC